MHLGLVAVSIVVMCWPDARLLLRYIVGLSSLGRMERTGVLKPVDPEPFIDEEELLASAAENMPRLSDNPSTRSSRISCGRNASRMK